MANSPSVYLLILTWNSRETVLECLDSVAQLEYGNLHPVVIDNGSEDGTPDAVRKTWGNRVHVIENGANLLFARGNNTGIQYALAQGADYVMLMNDDVVVDPKLVSELVAAVEADPYVGVAGPKIYYWEPRDQIWFAGGLVHLHKGTGEHIGIRETDHGQYDTPRDCDYITGCALLIKREVVEKIGPLDPDYFFYWEDADWCFRARDAGYRVRYVPSGKLWHKISVSSGGQLSKRKIRAKLRSGWTFFRRYARWYHWLTIPFYQVVDVLRVGLLIVSGRIHR